MNPIENFRNKAPEEKNKAYFVAILFCVFLVILLGIAILSMSLSYPKKHTTENYRGTAADSAVNEMSAGLLIKSENTLSSALSYAETYYATTPADKRSELAAKRFTELFYQDLRELAGIKANAKEMVVGSGKEEIHRVAVPQSQIKRDDNEETTTFAEYLESLAKKEREVSVSAEGNDMYIAYSETEHFVEIQNLRVSCGDGTNTSLNLRFTAPDNAAGDTASSYAGAVNAYAAVADGDIISTGGRNRIYGSVYGGTSIQAQAGGSFDINGETTVTRGEISTSGSAMMNILQGELWTGNIRTVSSGSYTGTRASGINMDIQADCFVSGDMILENPGHSVHVSGNYYGYGINEGSTVEGIVNEAAENAINGTAMDSILERLLAGSYTILTNEDGTTTTILSDEARAAAEAEAAKIASAAAMEAAGSTICIIGQDASTLVAYYPGQVLWLAATGYYDKAEPPGRPSINSTNVPNGLGSGKKDTGAANLDTLYTYQSNGLSAGLDKNAATSSPSYDLAAHLLDISGLKGHKVIYTDNGNGLYEAHELESVKGTSGEYIPIQPKSEYKTGVLIADCDVRLANTEFNGIIITTGNIIMTGGAVIRTDYAAARFTGVAETLEKSEENRYESRVTVSQTEVTAGRSKEAKEEADKKA